MIPQFIIVLLPVRDGKFTRRLKNHSGETISMDNIDQKEKVCVGRIGIMVHLPRAVQ